MGLSVTVRVCYAIDYGPHVGGNKAAWAWELSRHEDGGDGCEGCTFSAGDESNGRLVVYAQTSRHVIWMDHGGEFPPVVPLAEFMARSTAPFEAALREFTSKRGLPWKQPEWVIVTSQR